MAEIVDQVVDDVEFDAELDKKLGNRGRLRKELAAKDPELAKMFSEQTPAQVAWGKLIGRLILAKSNEAIEAAFEGWAKEFNEGVELRSIEKITAFFHALASLGSDEAHYRILRRMYIKANTNE